jgi:hypothetical protein
MAIVSKNLGECRRGDVALPGLRETAQALAYRLLVSTLPRSALCVVALAIVALRARVQWGAELSIPAPASTEQAPHVKKEDQSWLECA